MNRGFDLVSGGTDNHLLLVDLTRKNVTGKIAARALDRAGIELNYNTVPYDPRKPFDPSGIRLGTSALTSRGLEAAHMETVAAWIDLAVQHHGDDARLDAIAHDVRAFLEDFPAPGLLV
jgi:glycine hydroxymethyltransferase